MGIGIDIVHMQRFENKEYLAKRILSKEEYQIYATRSEKVKFLSGRFAAKEAFFKASQGLFGQVSFASISILYNENGVPYLKYQDHIYQVSISHDGEYATAIVIIE